MRRRYYSTRPPMPARQKLWMACFFISTALVALFLVFLFQLRGALSGLAVARVSNSVNQLVTASVEEALQTGVFQYDQLISFEKDGEGHIAALQSNMAEFNRLQASITQDILTRLGEMSDIELEIPVGTLSGSAFLAGRGPKMSVRMQSTGSCSARFENQFSHAGINQTTHQILLCVDVSVSILLPGFRTGTQVTNSFAVAETVIVGEVPDSYTYFDSGNPVEEDAFEYSINNG